MFKGIFDSIKEENFKFRIKDIEKFKHIEIKLCDVSGKAEIIKCSFNEEHEKNILTLAIVDNNMVIFDADTGKPIDVLDLSFAYLEVIHEHNHHSSKKFKF